MKTTFITLSAFALLSVVGVASVASAKNSAKPKVIYEKKTKIDLNEKDVDGQFLKPDGRAIRGDKNLSFDSLLSPADFSKKLKNGSGAF